MPISSPTRHRGDTIRTPTFPRHNRLDLRLMTRVISWRVFLCYRCAASTLLYLTEDRKAHGQVHDSVVCQIHALYRRGESDKVVPFLLQHARPAANAAFCGAIGPRTDVADKTEHVSCRGVLPKGRIEVIRDPGSGVSHRTGLWRRVDARYRRLCG
jgi:hypothetical protein